MLYKIKEVEFKYKNKVTDVTIFHDPEDIFKWFKNLQDETQEKFISIYLDCMNQVIAYSVDFVGGINTALIDPKVLMRNALIMGSVGIIFLHNHPSGSNEPSVQDITLYNRLDRMLKSIDLKIVDFVIIGNTYYSFKENGLLQVTPA